MELVISGIPDKPTLGLHDCHIQMIQIGIYDLVEHVVATY